MCCLKPIVTRSFETGPVQLAFENATSSADGSVNAPLARCTGPEALSMAQVAEKLSAATGRPIQYINLPPEEARQTNLANGMPPYTADALYELFAERRKGKEALVSNVIPEVFGWQPTPFEVFAARNAAIFRGEQPAPRI